MTYTPTPPPGAAFATIGEKTGRGRTTTGEPKVPEVEQQICRPAFGRLPAITHQLRNDARGRTFCATCGASWAQLDEQIREAS